MTKATWICFEDEVARRKVAHRAPCRLRDCESVVLSGWLERLGIEPAASPEVIATFFREVLPPPLHSERELWAEAVEDLRWAGVENEEHANYLFSQLPKEPKFQLLHFLINRYLREVGWDEHARIRSALDEVRSLLIVPPAEHLLFVHGNQPRAAFRELAEAFRQTNGVREVRYCGALEIVDAPEPTPGSQGEPCKTRALVLQGPALLRLDRLADALAHRMKHGRKSEVFLDCDETMREYLVWKLAKAGVSCVDFVAKAPQPANPSELISLNALLTKVRASTKLKVGRRLQIEKRLRRLALTQGTAEQWLASYAKIFDDGEIESLLMSVEPKRALHNERVDSPADSVGLFPWTASVRSDAEAFFFEQPSIALAPLSILSADDKKALARLGFGGAALKVDPPFEGHRAVLLLSDAGLLRHAQGIATRATRKRLTRDVQLIRTARSSALFADLARPGKAPSLSATSARSYLECPSRYFLQNVAGVYSDRNPRTDVQLYFGILAHKALELFFRPKMDPELAEITLPVAFERAYLETIRETSPWLRREVLETLWDRIADSIPKLESQLDTAFGPHSVRGIEFEFRVEWAGVILRGRVDRIDRLADGSLLLIDYKTGSVDFTPGHVAQGKDLQPWFYLHAVSSLAEPAAGILYYDLKGGEVCRGMILDKHVEKEHQKAFTRGHVVGEELFGKLLADGETQVRRVADGVLDGRFTPTPSASACQFCDFFLHCRSSVHLEGAVSPCEADQ